LGPDTVWVHIHPASLSAAVDAPTWVHALGAMLGPCTLSGATVDTGWGLDMSCRLPVGSPAVDLFSGPDSELDLSEDDTRAVGSLTVDTETVYRLWRALAEQDSGLDGAHSALLDVAEVAGLSLASLGSDALSGTLAVAVTDWPAGRRRLGLVGSLGVADEGMVAGLLDASRQLLSEAPGVRIESERVAGLEGWTVEWLRHRGYDLSVALGGDRVWFAFGSADLDDSLRVGSGDPWEHEGASGAVRVSLGELLSLEEVLGDVTLEASASAQALTFAVDLSRPPSVGRGRATAAVLDRVREALDARATAALMAQLSALCDAIDLHAVDHGLPSTLGDLAVSPTLIDPWGHIVDYVRPALRRPHHRYDLCSRGPDGAPGTPDDVCYE
ncbi:MAG: hypothetical protein QF464_08600, partial [Myxococcota bacterium]|nr:hypothetical protein [Myxococcota bacterium]